MHALAITSCEILITQICFVCRKSAFGTRVLGDKVLPCIFDVRMLVMDFIISEFSDLLSTNCLNCMLR